MALCPYCHSEKPATAPVCSECNNDTPFLFQVGFSIAFGALTLGMFVGVGYLFIWLF